MLKSVIAVAPLRISLVGGGTDIPEFYLENCGAVTVAAINRYVYVHVKRHDFLFDEKYRISYSKIELSNTRGEIGNDIVRGCLQYLEIDEPLQIYVTSDIPSNSGLGSSSSFAVALLGALHALRGEDVSRTQLAEEAFHVETQILGNPIGKQDQYAAALGGMNFIWFGQDGRVSISPIDIDNKGIENIFSHSLMIWTKQSRNAGDLLKRQSQLRERNESNLRELRDLARELKAILESKRKLSLEEIGDVIKAGWEIKRDLSPMIETPQVEEICNILESIDSVGYKLLGAGGGGFVFALFVDVAKARAAFSKKNAVFTPKVDFTGVRIISTF